MKTKQIVLAAMLGALLFIAQISLSFLPNIEIVTLLVLLYTLVFPSLTAPALILFAILEGLFYGFGLWWIMYLYLWPLWSLFCLFLRSNDSPLFWAISAAFFGLSFGLLCSIPYALAGGFYAGAAYFINGIPFDISHCIGNFFSVFVLYRPLKRAFLKIRASL